MNFNQIPDQTLLENTETLAKNEKEILTKILHHLLEIEKRRLHASLGFGSLFDYAVKKLGYSEDQAFRRISAMRLLKEIPEIEKKIEQGALTLSNITKAQALFRQESKMSQKLSKTEKLDVLIKLENKSAREAQRITFSLASTEVVKNQLNQIEKIKPLTEEYTEYKFTVDKNLHEKLVRLKNLRAHTKTNMSLPDLIEQLCDLALSKWDPCFKKAVQPKSPWTFKMDEFHKDKTSAILSVAEKPKVRNIPGKLKKQIWQKAQGCCENCQSQHALQIDHIKPYGKGGETVMQNLRLLCRSCNQRAAIEQYGIEKMQLHF